MPAFTILDALSDPNLFGGMSTFRDLSTWRSWLVFLRAAYGLPIEGEDMELFRRCTGRTVYDPPLGGYPEVVCIVGRQSGKTRIAALIASFEALISQREGDNTELYALLVAQDHRASLRTLFGYAKAPYESVPLLQTAVLETKAGSFRLKNGVTVDAYPCRPAAVRGTRARVAAVDELAFFLSTEGRPTDVEMLRALRPALSTTGGKLVILSSPYGQTGALWEIHRQHFGRDDSTTLVWQASAPDMNPSLPADYLEKMKRDDPEAYRSEVLGEFRAGVSTFFDPIALDACIVPDRRELLPAQGVRYCAFTDPSGGSQDSFALAIGHEDRQQGKTVIDCARAWKAPFNPSGVVAEAAEVLKAYRVGVVTGDRYAGEWPREQFRANGVRYSTADLDRSALYLELLPKVNSKMVELPDDATLLRELRGLERRRGTAGKDRIDHRPGEHDDVANAVAGVIHLCSGPLRPIDPAKTLFIR